MCMYFGYTRVRYYNIAVNAQKVHHSRNAARYYITYIPMCYRKVYNILYTFSLKYKYSSYVRASIICIIVDTRFRMFTITRARYLLYIIKFAMSGKT